MSEMMDKTPPQNLEAEMSLLGAILIDKDALLKIADIITPEDFYKSAHEKIFENILELFEKNEPIDLLTLSNRLNEKDLLSAIGGKTYLAQLTNTVPTSANAYQYAQIVNRKATRRRLLKASQEITKLSFEEEDDNVEKTLDIAQQYLFGVSQTHMKENFSPIKGVLGEAFDRIDELHKNKGQMRGLATGFYDLDNVLGGLQKSDLIVLAARPSVGKTSLALDMVRNIGSKLKAPVGLFSLEMSKEQLVDRLLCSEAGVDLWKLRTGNLSENPEDGDFPKIGRAMGVLSEAPIYIDDTASLNIMQIRTKARRLQAEHGLSLIVIDYLQLMDSARKSSDGRVQEVAEITRGLKGIARELNIPVLALSQLSRVVEQSKPAIPKLSHLRESGSIEQDADVVMFIYRKSADKNYRDEDIPPDEKNIAEIHISKHRNGPTGVVKTIFNPQFASFRSLARNYRTEQSSTPTLKTKEELQKGGAPPMPEPQF